jgi:hypothetical protein
MADHQRQGRAIAVRSNKPRQVLFTSWNADDSTESGGDERGRKQERAATTCTRSRQL